MYNSRQYEFSDISLIVGGNDLSGFRGVKYSEKQELEALHAKGKHAHSIQSGNIDVEGELTLLQSELEALLKAGKGSLAGLPSLTIIVAYGNPSTGDPLIIDRIEGVRFSQSEKEMKQGDKFMEVKLPFLALRVAHNVTK